MFFFCNFELIIHVCILNKISDIFLKYILIILLDLYMSLSRFIFGYPDPDQRFLKWIRIWIRPNDTDPTGSGSETLGVYNERIWAEKLNDPVQGDYVFL